MILYRTEDGGRRRGHFLKKWRGLALLLLAEPAGHQFTVLRHSRRPRDGRFAGGRWRTRPVNIGRILRLQNDVLSSTDRHSRRLAGVVDHRRRHYRRLTHHGRLLLIAVSDFEFVAIVARFPRRQHRIRTRNVAAATQRRSRSAGQRRHVLAALSFASGGLQLMGACGVGHRRHRRDVGHRRRVQIDGTLALAAGRALHGAAVALRTVDWTDRLFICLSTSIQQSPNKLKDIKKELTQLNYFEWPLETKSEISFELIISISKRWAKRERLGWWQTRKSGKDCVYVCVSVFPVLLMT